MMLAVAALRLAADREMLPRNVLVDTNTCTTKSLARTTGCDDNDSTSTGPPPAIHSSNESCKMLTRSNPNASTVNQTWGKPTDCRYQVLRV